MAAEDIGSLDVSTLGVVCDYLTVDDHLHLNTASRSVNQVSADPQCWQVVDFGGIPPSADLLDMLTRQGANIEKLSCRRPMRLDDAVAILEHPDVFPSLRHLRIYEITISDDSKALGRHVPPLQTVRSLLTSLVFNPNGPRVTRGLVHCFSFENMRSLHLANVSISTWTFSTMPRIKSLRLEGVTLVHAREPPAEGEPCASLKVLEFENVVNLDGFPWYIVPATLKSLSVDAPIGRFLSFAELKAPAVCTLKADAANADTRLYCNARRLNFRSAVLNLPYDVGFPHLATVTFDHCILPVEHIAPGRIYLSGSLTAVEMQSSSASLIPPMDTFDRLTYYRGDWPIHPLAFAVRCSALQTLYIDQSPTRREYLFRGDHPVPNCTRLKVRNARGKFLGIFDIFPKLQILTIESSNLDFSSRSMVAIRLRSPTYGTESWTSLKELHLIECGLPDHTTPIPYNIQTLETTLPGTLANVDFEELKQLKKVICRTATVEDIVSLKTSQSVEEISVRDVEEAETHLVDLVACPNLRILHLRADAPDWLVHDLRRTVDADETGRHVKILRDVS